MQECCTTLILGASATKTEFKAVNMTACLFGCPADCGTDPSGSRECDSWAVRTGKALAAPQDSSSRTMDSPGESRASFFCFLHQISWRVSCKTRTSTRTFWTFCHFYKSSKSHQVAHPWFQKSASTEVFLLWPKVESIWINWIQSLPHPLKHLTVS